MPSQMTIYVPVPKYLKEYYNGYSKSVISLPKKSRLLKLVSSLLEPQPATKLQQNYAKNECVKLILPYLSHKGINVNYRNYVQDKGLQLIALELEAIFRNRLHAFIVGYTIAASQRHPFSVYGTQRQAIEDFCKIHNITFENVNFDSLKKSFDRSEDKFFLKNVVQICPFW